MNVLFIAYKIEAGKGSEDATSYHIIPELINLGCNVTLVTRENNIKKLKNDPLYQFISFVSVELPTLVTIIKKYTFGMILYYFLWQIKCGRTISKLSKLHSYQAIHQFNFHASWCPHFIYNSASRIIFGPLTRHAMVPMRFWYGSGFGYITEIFKELVKVLLHRFNPLLLTSLNRSNIIYLGQKKLFYPYNLFKDKVYFLPQAASVFPIQNNIEIAHTTFNVLFVGKLINLKGVMIALESFKHFTMSLDIDQRKNVTLTIIGSGPLEKMLRTFIHDTCKHNDMTVHFYDWMKQDDLKRHYADASAFLYPSFEGQGLVVAEAMAYHTPIICFEGTGPHDVAGKAALTVPISTKEETITNISLTLKRLASEYWHDHEAYNTRCRISLERAMEIDWKNKASQIVQHYNE